MTNYFIKLIQCSLKSGQAGNSFRLYSTSLAISRLNKLGYTLTNVKMSVHHVNGQ